MVGLDASLRYLSFNTQLQHFICWIYLKPNSKFRFICCLAIYQRKLNNLDQSGTLEGPFHQGSLNISLTGFISGTRRVPWTLFKYHNDKKCVPKWWEAIENVLCRKGKNSLRKSQTSLSWVVPSSVVWVELSWVSLSWGWDEKTVLKWSWSYLGLVLD